MSKNGLLFFLQFGRWFAALCSGVGGEEPFAHKKSAPSGALCVFYDP